MLAELGLTLATSKVKRDEPSPDRPHDQCVNLFLFFGIRVIMVLESGSFANLVSRPPPWWQKQLQLFKIWRNLNSKCVG